MTMDLTDSNKTEIRLIAQEVVKEYAINVREDIKNLTRDLKEILSNYNTNLDNKLTGITNHFNDQIKLLVLERKNDIQIETSERKLCRMHSDKQFLGYDSELRELGNLMLTRKDVFWMMTKMTSALVGFAVFILTVLAMMLK